MNTSDDLLSQSALKQYVDSVCPENYLEDLLEIIREHVNHDLPHYSDSLKHAFKEVEPIFARKRYAEFFWHCSTTVPGYTERVVLANGPAEAEGSEKLFDLWQGVNYNEHVAEQILKHSYDEQRHSRIFVRIAERAFPQFLTMEAGAQFEKTLPDVKQKELIKSETVIPENHLIDHLAQMNIGEIRTRLHMHLFAPIIYGFTPEESRKSIRKLLEGLVKDEVSHIGYTARLMESWAEDGNAEYIKKLYTGRLHAFNHITVKQDRKSVV